MIQLQKRWGSSNDILNVLLAGLPDILFLCRAIVEIYAVLEALRQGFFGPGAAIVDVESIVKRAGPTDRFIEIAQIYVFLGRHSRVSAT